LIKETEEGLRAAVAETLKSKGVQLPIAAREWAETFLGYEHASETAGTAVETGSDVNLERMGTLLLASWEARDDGPNSTYLFELFSGICKAAFRLSLEGNAGSVAFFDPSIHEASRTSVSAGKKVRLMRPWVQWGDAEVVRIIIRALVSPLAPEST
jgi:hypothetical protein